MLLFAVAPINVDGPAALPVYVATAAIGFICVGIARRLTKRLSDQLTARAVRRRQGGRRAQSEKLTLSVPEYRAHRKLI